MKPQQHETSPSILKMRAHLSCLFPAKTKTKAERGLLFDGAVILFDFCSRKRSVPPQDEWPDEVADGLKQALIDCDGEFFRAMAKAADSMKAKRTKHAENVSTMIYFAADHLKKTGVKATKQQLIVGTHKLMVKIGKPTFPIDSPQEWRPIIRDAGFVHNDKARSKGTAKNHGEGATSPRKRK
jgi:hypothetical protein